MYNYFSEIHQDKDLHILFNEGRDIKLQLDIDTEQIIKGAIGSKNSFSILGEETGLSDNLGEFYWVVDPLDGTSNFLRNMTFFTFFQFRMCFTFHLFPIQE